ncbi:Disease resistance protein [Melia azedarach]|uniref:Disease resistance protein n=1 Tax=Melia azedarach TaxID=155640 RepID=A0ACC1WUZ7_MELAZ|nr:Disease resistance protein [Melia azedarach]
MATEAMLSILIEKIFTGLMYQARFALDYKEQLEAMHAKLDHIRTVLSSTDNLKNRGKDAQKYLPRIRKLIYEAEDILTDCLIRDEYQEEESCWSSSTHGVLFRYKTGKQLSKINSRMEMMQTSVDKLLSSNPPINQENYLSQDYDPSEIVGFVEDVKTIKEWILSGEEELNRIGIVGMGGIGKTALAQKIFRDEVADARFEKKIWLSVSQNFSRDQIMRVMLKKLGEDSDRIDENNLLHKIHETLGNRSYLIVVDDVWRMHLDWWNKLWPTSKRSFIIITSRDEDVAKKMGVDILRIHRPNRLNANESWSLFSTFAFSRCGGNCPGDQFKNVGREILDKCGGLPLAIKTIGALIAQDVRSLSYWKRIKKDFRELANESEDGVTASLQLSYDKLPSHLKQCLLCFSIYSEGFVISGEQIVHWWVGEGLIQLPDTKTATDLGFQYLSDLVSRCLVEAVHRRGYYGRVYSCKMHDLVRDMIIEIAKDEAFCSFDDQGQQKLSEESRWLGFTSHMTPHSLKNSPKLRTLIMMSSAPVLLNSKLSSLRVLDFSDMKLNSDEVKNLWKTICSLKRLANLNLSGVEGLKEVPSSIRKLRNLQILVLRKCNNLAIIPPSITDLKKLIVLDLGSCSLEYLPCGLGRLVHLQELSGFPVVSQADTKCCPLRALLELEHLRVLQININGKTEISEENGDILSQLEKLQVLAIDAEQCEEKIVSEMLDLLSPPPKLEELYLMRYHHETLPKWMNLEQLSNLQYLCLEDAHIIDFDTKPKSCEDCNDSKWFLEGLCLKHVPNLVLDWGILISKDMPLLCYAEISNCSNLKNYPYPNEYVWRRNQDRDIHTGKRDGKSPASNQLRSC